MAQWVKDPALSLLCVTLVMVMAQVQSLAQELLHSMGAAKKKKKKRIHIYFYQHMKGRLMTYNLMH